MLVKILGSGSKGNSTYINVNDTHILIDAGFSLKQIEKRLEDKLSNINYIFITHTHSDHIKGLKQIVKRYKPFIVASQNVINEIDYLVDYEHLIYLCDNFVLNDINIKAIKTSHDTESYGFIIDYKEKSLAYITDTGYINSKNFDTLKNKNMYILESNHDIELLMNGKYPSWLKSRVMSDYGHLSNQMASFYLTKFVTENTKEIVLAHLSAENNSDYLALKEIKDTFELKQIKFNNIYIAKQNETKEFRI